MGELGPVMKRRFLLICLLLMFSSCAGLIIRKEDGFGKTSSKVLARVLLAVPTFGQVEHQISLTKKREQSQVDLARRGKELSNTMESWVGKKKSELIFSWGSPTNIHKTEDGGEILEYVYDNSITLPGYSTSSTYNRVFGHGGSNTYGTYTPARTFNFQKRRSFRTDSKGVITRWTWKGL